MSLKVASAKQDDLKQGRSQRTLHIKSMTPKKQKVGSKEKDDSKTDTDHTTKDSAAALFFLS